MTETNFADHAANLEAELNHLRAKSAGDDEMIALLKRQLETQGMEATMMVSRHAEDLRQLRARCDLAVRNEKEINGILNTAASGIVAGLRKMKGDAVPAPEAPAQPEPAPALPAPLAIEPPAEVREFAPRFARPARPEMIVDVDDGLRNILNRLPRATLSR